MGKLATIVIRHWLVIASLTSTFIRHARSISFYSFYITKGLLLSIIMVRLYLVVVGLTSIMLIQASFIVLHFSSDRVLINALVRLSLFIVALPS